MTNLKSLIGMEFTALIVPYQTYVAETLDVETAFDDFIEDVRRRRKETSEAPATDIYSKSIVEVLGALFPSEICREILSRKDDVARFDANVATAFDLYGDERDWSEMDAPELSRHAAKLRAACEESAREFLVKTHTAVAQDEDQPPGVRVNALKYLVDMATDGMPLDEDVGDEEGAISKTDVLQEAIATVADRDTSYGTVQENFNRIAARWTAHMRNRYDNPNSEIAPLSAFPAFDAFDVAVMMADVKLARLELDPTHHDSWVDVAGYAGCGGELASKARNSA